MRESSWAERTVAGIFAALLTLLSYVAVRVNDLHDDVSGLNREVGESVILMETHITNHPNVALEEDVERLQQRWLDHQTGHAR